MMKNNEEKIVAKGLSPPGPLLVVKKKLKTIEKRRVRVIVSNREAAEEIVDFFKEHNVDTEIDRAGDDFHVIVDLQGFEEGE